MSNNRATFISALLGFVVTSGMIILTNDLINLQNLM